MNEAQKRRKWIKVYLPDPQLDVAGRQLAALESIADSLRRMVPPTYTIKNSLAFDILNNEKPT